MKNKNNAKSIQNLQNLLIEIATEPSVHINDHELMASLSSQGKLAKWQSESKGIYGCSLNTLKKTAENLFKYGFEEFDQLRIAALEAVQGFKTLQESPQKTTKAGLALMVEEKKQHIRVLEHQNALLVLMLSQIRSKCFKYASEADEKTQALCKKEMSEISRMLNVTGKINLDLELVIDER